MSRSKAKGTAWETAIVTYLHKCGWPTVERRALQGNQDRGDIAGIPGVVIEAKNTARVELGRWLTEAHQERNRDQALIGAVWFKRRGRTSAGDGYVLMDGETFVRLLTEAGYQ